MQKSRPGHYEHYIKHLMSKHIAELNNARVRAGDTEPTIGFCDGEGFLGFLKRTSCDLYPKVK